MAMLANKRISGTATAEEGLRKSKKRKTTPTTAVPSTLDNASESRSSQRKEQKKQRPQAASQEPTHLNKAVVVPATPGTRVSPLPTTKRGSKGIRSVEKEGVVSAEADGGAPLKQNHQDTKGEHGQQSSTKKQMRNKAKQNQPPSTLPTEPHVSILSELQPHHDVRVLSVISSSRMEKRIKSVLEHLASRRRRPPVAGPPVALPSTELASGTLPAPAPGVVLLHSRASDASKMISIVEIAKRRIREGCFDDPAAAAAEAPEERNGNDEEAMKKQAKKRKQKKRRAEQRQRAWYQYNRIYDVESVASSHAVDGSDGDEDDDFEPMPKQFKEALADKDPSTITTTTYMSIVLSRVPLPVLERHPEITAQASDDTLETEYQSWISSMT